MFVHSTDLLIATVAAIVFVPPSVYHLVDDARTRSSRSFSLIPHKGRHIAAGVFRLTLLGGTALVSGLAGEQALSFFVWILTLSFLAGMMAVGATARRLIQTLDSSCGETSTYPGPRVGELRTSSTQSSRSLSNAMK